MLWVVVAMAALSVGILTSPAPTATSPSIRDVVDVGVGGASGAAKSPNREVTKGSYESSVSGPYADPGAEQEGSAAARIDDANPPFIGWLNGIYLFPESNTQAEGFSPDPAANALPRLCPGIARLVSEEELKGTPYYIPVPSKLPPGAVETEETYGGACGKEITVVSRQYDLQPYGGAIGIVLRPQAKGAPFPTSAARVSAIAVNGMPAVQVLPVTEAGFGNSAVFILTPVGLAQVGGYDIRFEDLLAVAESIQWG